MIFGEQPKIPIPVVVMGLGPVGRSIARGVFQSRGLELVAALDIDPDLVGMRLVDLIDAVNTDLVVSSDADTAFARAKNGIVLQATGSRLSDVTPQVLSAVRAGLSIISTCPELAYPWLDHAETAEILDQAARENRVAILAAGVNPGFALDRLVSCAGLVSGNIRHVHAQRSVDIANRRVPLLTKAGVGLSEPEFKAQTNSGAVGHVGLNHSAALAAVGLGLDYDEIIEEVQPVISEKAWDGPVAIQPGQTAGYQQSVRVFHTGREVVRLDLTYAVGTSDHDSILIDADPKIDLVIRGGVSGDAATTWSVLNAAQRVMRAGFGLLTVLDLPSGLAPRRLSV